MGVFGNLTEKVISIRIDQEDLECIRIEAQTEEITIRSIFQKIIKGYINKSEVLPMVTNVDLAIKQKKLDVETEKHRKLKNDNDHFEKYGYYPTKPANYITKIVEQPKQEPAQKTWIGSSYGSDEKDINKYHSQISSLGKSKIVSHECPVKKSTIEYDIYKRVQCSYCGATL